MLGNIWEKFGINYGKRWKRIGINFGQIWEKFGKIYLNLDVKMRYYRKIH